MSFASSKIPTAVAVGLATATLFLSVPQAPAGVYNDVTAWWQLDMADSGIPTAGDIRDQRYWGSSGGNIATSVSDNPQWTSGLPAYGPGGGQGYGGRGLTFDSFNDDFRVSGLTLAGDATVVTRIKWDGPPTNGDGSGILYSNGFNWSGNQGWLWRLSGASGNVGVYYGQGTFTPTTSWTTDTSKWYDLAVVFDDQPGASDTITFYRWQEGGAFEKATFTGNLNGGAVNTAAGTIVGQEGYNFNGFGGTIDHIAAWNRALTETEIHDAFGAPDPLGSIGIDNGTPDDLRYEGAVDADYTVGQPWHEMRRAVTASANQANIHFALPPELAALNYVFHVETNGTGGGNPADLSLTINGVPLGTKTVNPNSDYLWVVPAGTLVPGANTVGLQYEGGPAAYISWDWMELGGGWQVGYDDNNQAEFSSEGSAPDDFYVTDLNWLHLERALTASDPQTNLHFNLSPELADVFAYQYATRVISQGGGTHPFDVLVNGDLLANVPANPDNTLLKFIIPSSMLQAGDNVISLRYADTSGYVQFDFHKFEVFVPEPSTMVLLGLGLFGVAARFARRRIRGGFPSP